MTRQRTARLLAAAFGAAALVGAVLDAPPASAATTGLIWTMRWSAPTTAQGPNRFTGSPALSGTAAPALGSPTRIDATVAAPPDLPASCGAFPRPVPIDVQGSNFTVHPDLACNGTYSVTVVARAGIGMLATSSPPLTAPVTLADAGGQVGGVTGAVANGGVTVSWNQDGDPDVIGYRLQRNGTPVTDVPASRRTATDAVPGPGTYRYDIVTLRWGGDGPGSSAIASGPSSPYVAVVAPNTGPATMSPAGANPAGGPGHSDPAGASTKGGSGSLLSGLPAPGKTSDKAPNRTSGKTTGAKRPGTKGSGSSGRRAGSSGDGATTGTTLDDGFAERLPYAARTRTEPVSESGRPATKTVSRVVRIPHGPGLVMPFVLVGLLLGGSFALRRVLRRAGAVAESAS